MTTWGHGPRAAELLATSGLCTMTPGLTDAELQAVEARFGFVFNDDHREFLAAGLPVGPSWPDWRNGDETELRSHLGVPVRHILRAVSKAGLWRHTWGTRPDNEHGAYRIANDLLATAPRMVPVYGYAFTPAGPARLWAAVWSIEGGDARRAADDLTAFVRRQLGQRISLSAAKGHRVPFWDDYAENPELEKEPDLPDLTVPPFPPDPPAPEAAAVLPPRDPAARLAELGVELGPLTRHDDVLVHRAPLWTAAVTPGLGALHAWAALRDHFPTTGLWPVLITERTWHRIGDDGISDTEPVLAAQLDGAAWLSAEYARRTERDPLPRGWEPWAPTGADWQADWSRTHQVERFDRVALVPTPAHYFVPGLLQWSGALNCGVRGIQHAAVLRRWTRRWGAELVALDDETAILHMTSPPSFGAESLEAAVEAYLYCLDSIDTNPDGVDALAPFLIRPMWTFWWD